MKFVVSVLVAVLIGGCANSDSSSKPGEEVATSSSSVTTTTLGNLTDNTSTTSVVGSPSSLPAGVSTSIAVASQSSVAGTGASSSSMVRSSTTLAVTSRPKLVVSQTVNLNPNGTSVTVRGTGYDVSKGVYVIVCSQAAPGPQATCIGGVNIDGSSSSSVWVSSNPPNYAVGLTTPFQPDGSFTVELVIVAKSGALDCTILKCGVVTRSDHLRYTDRSQDVFVPITFSN